MATFHERGAEALQELNINGYHVRREVESCVCTCTPTVPSFTFLSLPLPGRRILFLFLDNTER